MSYKYTNVREYDGELIFYCSKSSKTDKYHKLTVGATGIQFQPQTGKGLTIGATAYIDGSFQSTIQFGNDLTNPDTKISGKYITLQSGKIGSGTHLYSTEIQSKFVQVMQDSTAKSLIEYNKITVYTNTYNGYDTVHGDGYFYVQGRNNGKVVGLWNNQKFTIGENLNLNPYLSHTGAYCALQTNGLYLDDGTGNTCYLKFEGGKLLINGKEIATVEE